MEKMYRVTISYSGAIYFDVEAENTTQAEQLAQELFDEMNDRELVANLCEIGIDEVFEV